MGSARCGGSEGPGAVAEEGNGPAVFTEGVDGKVGCADHEVLMDHGVVHAERAALVERLMLEIADGVGEAHAEREMAAGVLVEQCIVEQDAGFVDRGVERHEGRHL